MERIKGMLKQRHLRMAIEHIKIHISDPDETTAEELAWSIDVVNRILTASNKMIITDMASMVRCYVANDRQWFEYRMTGPNALRVETFFNASILEDRYPEDLAHAQRRKDEYFELQQNMRYHQSRVEEIKVKMNEIYGQCK